MPLYTFTCEAGHKRDLVRSRNVEVEHCACGLPARRESVYHNSPAHRWASEFHFNSSMQAAHEEAKGYAAEVRAISAEERANGYQ